MNACVYILCCTHDAYMYTYPCVRILVCMYLDLYIHTKYERIRLQTLIRQAIKIKPSEVFPALALTIARIYWETMSGVVVVFNPRQERQLTRIVQLQQFSITALCSPLLMLIAGYCAYNFYHNCTQKPTTMDSRERR